MLSLPSTLATIFLLAAGCWEADAANLLPYGAASGDRAMARGDDNAEGPFALPEPFQFYGQGTRQYYIATNGLTTFDGSFTEYVPRPFPVGNNVRMIAVFWTDLDTRPVESGLVWHRVVSSTSAGFASLSAATRGDIPDQSFAPSAMLVATWDRVGTYNRITSNLVTVQMILLWNVDTTYCLFRYQFTYMLSHLPRAGFDAGSASVSTAMPSTGTTAARSWNTASNTAAATPGHFVFRIDGEDVASTPTGCTGDAASSGGLVPISHQRISHLGSDRITLQTTICGVVGDAFTCGYRNHRTGNVSEQAAFVASAAGSTGRVQITCPTPIQGSMPIAVVRLTITRDRDGFDFDGGLLLVGAAPMRSRVTCASVDLCYMDLVFDRAVAVRALALLDQQPNGMVSLRFLAQNYSSTGNASIAVTVTHALERAVLEGWRDGAGGPTLRVTISADDFMMFLVYDAELSFNGTSVRETVASTHFLQPLAAAWTAFQPYANGSAAAPPPTSTTSRRFAVALATSTDVRNKFAEWLAQEAFVTVVQTVLNLFPLGVYGRLAMCLLLNASINLFDKTVDAREYLPYCPQTEQQIEVDTGGWVVDSWCSGDGSATDCFQHRGALGLSPVAHRCYTSIVTGLSTSRAQCCYTSQGQYVASGNGAGRYDIVHPDTSWIQHQLFDTVMWTSCCTIGILDLVMAARFKPALEGAIDTLESVAKVLARIVGSKTPAAEIALAIGSFVASTHINGNTGPCKWAYEWTHPITLDVNRAPKSAHSRPSPDSPVPAATPRQAIFQQQQQWGTAIRWVTPTMTTGDPHFMSIDGGLFTFNGRGEYLLLSRGALRVQARLEGVGSTSTSSLQPTVVTAIAMGVDGADPISVAATASGALRLLVGGAEIAVPGGEADVQFPLSGPMTVAFNTTNATHASFKMRYDTVVEIAVSVVHLTGSARAFSMQLNVAGNADTVASTGMLGSADGNADNDLCHRVTRVCVPMNSSEQAIYNTAQSWSLTSAAESLFTYSTLFPFSFYQTPSNFQPLLLPAFTSAGAAACGTTTSVTRTQDFSRWACLFDFAVTNNMELARSSTVLQARTEQQQRLQLPPPRLLNTSTATDGLASGVFDMFDLEFTEWNPTVDINASSASFDGSPVVYMPHLVRRIVHVASEADGIYRVQPFFQAIGDSAEFSVDATDGAGRTSTFVWTMTLAGNLATASPSPSTSHSHPNQSTSSTASPSQSASLSSSVSDTPSQSQRLSHSTSDSASASGSSTNTLRTNTATSASMSDVYVSETRGSPSASATASPSPPTPSASQSHNVSETAGTQSTSLSASLIPPTCGLFSNASDAGTPEALWTTIALQANCTTPPLQYDVVFGYFNAVGTGVQRRMGPNDTVVFHAPVTVAHAVMTFPYTISTASMSGARSVTFFVTLELNGVVHATTNLSINATSPPPETAMASLITVRFDNPSFAMEQSALLGALLRQNLVGNETLLQTASNVVLANLQGHTNVTTPGALSRNDRNMQEMLLSSSNDVLAASYNASWANQTVLRSTVAAVSEHVQRLAQSAATNPMEVNGLAFDLLQYRVLVPLRNDTAGPNTTDALDTARWGQALAGAMVAALPANTTRDWTSGAIAAAGGTYARVDNLTLRTPHGNVSFPPGFDATRTPAGGASTVTLVVLGGGVGTASAQLDVVLRDYATGNPVTAFNAPVRLHIRTTAALPWCVFFDEASGSWSPVDTIAPSAAGIDRTDVAVCATTHFTMFSTSAEGPPAPNGDDGPSTAAVVGGAVGGAVFAVVAVAIVVVMIRRYRNRRDSVVTYSEVKTPQPNGSAPNSAHYAQRNGGGNVPPPTGKVSDDDK